MMFFNHRFLRIMTEGNAIMCTHIGIPNMHKIYTFYVTQYSDVKYNCVTAGPAELQFLAY